MKRRGCDPGDKPKTSTGGSCPLTGSCLGALAAAGVDMGWGEESGCWRAQNRRAALKETPGAYEEYGTAEWDLRSPEGRLGTGPCTLTH